MSAIPKDVIIESMKAFIDHLTNTTPNPVSEKGETSKIEKLEEVIDSLRAENNFLSEKLKKCNNELSEARQASTADKGEISKKDNVVDDLEEELNDQREKNVIILKLREYGDELKEIRQALIDGLENLLPASCELTVKHMGEIDDRPFIDAYASKYADEPHKIDKYAASTLSNWQKKISDPHWHPFSVTLVQGEHEAVVNANDPTLKRLKRNHGNDAYHAVVQALKEMNQYNASGRYVVKEFWNKRLNRKASLKEIIFHAVTMIEVPELPELPEEPRNKRARSCKG